MENMGSGSSGNANYKYSLQKSENGECLFEKSFECLLLHLLLGGCSGSVFILSYLVFFIVLSLRSHLSVSCNKESQLSGRPPTGMRK